MEKRFPSGEAAIKTGLPRLTSRFQAPNPYARETANH
jgi:hypothetical protein